MRRYDVGRGEMKRALAALAVLTAIAPMTGNAAITVERGARAKIVDGDVSASIRVEEISTLNGRSERSGSLTLTVGDTIEILSCTYTMSGDPFLTASGSMQATCGDYQVAASFVIPGGGAGDFALVCRADLSRGSRTTVRITQAATTIVEGITTDSRVWTNVDLDTCEE